MWRYKSITVCELGDFYVEEVYEVQGEGILSSRTRHVRPGEDVSGESQRVQDIANLIWTDEVLNDYGALPSQV